MQVRIQRGRGDEAEKPFWISFSDLMTAMMVLFLVVMSVALLAIAKDVTTVIDDEEQRKRDITGIIRDVEVAVKEIPNARFDEGRYAIDLGPVAYFEFGKDALTPKQAETIRGFVVGKLLPIARTEAGERWLSRIIVEGYTDKVGNYLSNLNLSLRRSQRVLCVLLTPGVAQPLDKAAERLVRERFLVGGYSSSLATSDANASRKVEFRLEFRGLRETAKVPPDMSQVPSGDCGI
jgi:outer membrane protein OmpA-like peptidoglycan-associated protein